MSIYHKESHIYIEFPKVQIALLKKSENSYTATTLFAYQLAIRMSQKFRNDT